MASSAVATSTAIGGPSTASTTKATQRVRIIHPATLAKHNSVTSLWVSYQNRVYDVTDFAPDHPGGDDLILQYAGKDMGDIMSSPEEHSHSDSAFELLEEHFIGRLPLSQEEEALAAPEKIGGAGLNGEDQVVITDDFVQPEDTDVANDFKKHQFLDLNKPLIMQVWNAKFSKQFYLEQVHRPRHLKDSARLFGPSYMEVLTRTPWYVVPIVWLPISLALFVRSAYQFSQWGQSASPVASGSLGSAAPAAAASAFVNASKIFRPDLDVVSAATAQTTSSITLASLGFALPCFLLGIFVWTILEYTLHRFLFHIDELLPDKPFFLMLHFLLHGIHHYLPMDRLRLVMPPVLFSALSFPFTRLAYALFPVAVANGIISGAFFMYVGYDTMHYALHHTKLPDYIKEMKAYHMRHHYVNPDEGFGVTSKLWDIVFGTQL